MQNGPTWCNSSCHEVASEFFVMNATDPPHWSLNSRFGVFRTLWMHLGPFGCRKKLGAKLAEVVPKFVPRSRVRIFRNERSPLDPKLRFHSVSYYFGAFGTVRLRYKTQCKTGQTDAKVRATRWRRIFSQRTQPIHPIGLQTLVLVCIVLFGCIWDRFVAVQNSVQNGPNWWKSSCHEVAS